MNSPLSDWETLSAEWRAETIEQPSSDLREELVRRVRRHDRSQRFVLAVEIAITIGALVLVQSMLATSGTWNALGAAAVIAMVVIVWTFTIWNRRGSWRPLGESTSEYIRLSNARAREGRRTIRFIRIALSLGTLGYLPWFVAELERGAVHGAALLRWVGYAVYVTSFLVWCGWYARRITDDVNVIREVERAANDESMLS